MARILEIRGAETPPSSLERLDKARAGLILDQPFFGSLLLRLKSVEDKTCKTTWTDGETLGYNPEYLAGKSVDAIKYILCHNVTHCALRHHVRRGNRNGQVWQTAADHVVNGFLRECGMQVPPGEPSDFGDKSVDEAYQLLYHKDEGDNGKNQNKNQNPDGDDEEQTGKGQGDDGDGDGDGQDGPGEVRDAPAEDEQAQDQTWKMAMISAAQVAKSMGVLPGGAARMVEKLKNPTVDWRAVLREFVERCAKSDYSWNPPSRRDPGRDVVRPSLSSDDLPEILVAIDTSGSIDAALLTAFLAEIGGARFDFNASVTVIQCDTEIGSVDTFEPSDDLEVKPTGGGGTDFRPVFDWVQSNREQPRFLIYFTDLQGQFPPVPPDYPTLWAVWDANPTPPPFGEVVFCK